MNAVAKPRIGDRVEIVASAVPRDEPLAPMLVGMRGTVVHIWASGPMPISVELDGDWPGVINASGAIGTSPSMTRHLSCAPDELKVI